MSTSEELAENIILEIGLGTVNPMPRERALVVIVKLLDQWYKDTVQEVQEWNDPEY